MPWNNSPILFFLLLILGGWHSPRIIVSLPGVSFCSTVKLLAQDTYTCRMMGGFSSHHWCWTYPFPGASSPPSLLYWLLFSLPSFNPDSSRLAFLTRLLLMGPQWSTQPLLQCLSSCAVWRSFTIVVKQLLLVKHAFCWQLSQLRLGLISLF